MGPRRGSLALCPWRDWSELHALLNKQMHSASVSCPAVLLAAASRAACSAAWSALLVPLAVAETVTVRLTAMRCPSKMQHKRCSILMLAHAGLEQSHHPLSLVVRMLKLPIQHPLLDVSLCPSSLVERCVDCKPMNTHFSILSREGSGPARPLDCQDYRISISLAEQSSLSSSINQSFASFACRQWTFTPTSCM